VKSPRLKETSRRLSHARLTSLILRLIGQTKRLCCQPGFSVTVAELTLEGQATTQGPGGQGAYLVPSGGTVGQVLSKSSNVDGQFACVTLSKASVGLSAVASTSPADLPVSSTAVQSALDLKANLSPLTKAGVGLGNVDSTSDANKPVSTAQQTALDLKANLASPSITGVLTTPNTMLSSTPSTTTSNVLYYNSTSKAVSFGAAPSGGGSTTYTGGTPSSVASGGGNFRTGPGQVWNPSAQNFGFANSGDCFFVPPGTRVYSYTSSWDWLAYS
jgi:hypothetical protein